MLCNVMVVFFVLTFHVACLKDLLWDAELESDAYI